MTPLKQLQVLVVEDEPQFCGLVELYLETLGHTCRFASNASLGLDQAIQRSFDVLLTDVALPDRDGWSLVSDLRALGYLPPVVISMSAYGGGDEEATSESEGCVAHLPKPFALEDLLHVLPTESSPDHCPPLD